MYSELVTLLSGRTLDDEAVREMVAELDAALREPEEWMLDFDPETIRQLTVELAVIDYVLIGDKIDELHELISDDSPNRSSPFHTATITKSPGCGLLRVARQRAGGEDPGLGIAVLGQ